MGKSSYLCNREKNMLNVNQKTMKTMTFASEAETLKKVHELLTTEGTKFKVIGRRQIVIFK